MKKTLISVIMSVYNGECFLREAIDSILNQTFSDFEFIITDDGSTDNTPDILNEYSNKDSRIILINHENIGLTESLNLMISKAKGEFIARMDADDISFLERLEKLFNKLQEDKDCLATGCWFQIINENNLPEHEIVFPDKPELLKKYLHKGINCYAHGSVLMRKTIFDTLGFSYRFKFGQDFDLWLRLCELGYLRIVEDVLYQQRIHSNAISKSLIPRRAALMNLMISLTKERKKYGREISNWGDEEAKILKDIPLWTEKEKLAYEMFLQARGLLLSGENTRAKRILSQIKKEFNNFNGFLTPYFISFFPGFVTSPFLKLRDQINDKRYFKRTLKRC